MLERFFLVQFVYTILGTKLMAGEATMYGGSNIFCVLCFHFIGPTRHIYMHGIMSLGWKFPEPQCDLDKQPNAAISL